MLRALSRVLGVNLDRKLAQLHGRFDELTTRAIAHATEQVKETGLTVGLLLIGAIATLLTLIVVLAALYLWVDTYHGPFVALAVVGAVTASLAALMFVLAYRRARRQPVPAPLYLNPAASPAPSASSPVLVSAALPPLPPNASLFDYVTHRFTTRVATAGDEALDAAVHAMRNSSRPALFGTLAVVALVGVLIGRRR